MLQMYINKFIKNFAKKNTKTKKSLINFFKWNNGPSFFLHKDNIFCCSILSK